MDAPPHKKDLCLKLIDETSISKFIDPFDYGLLGLKPVPKVIKKPYIYPSNASIAQLEKFLCKDYSSMQFISSPFAAYNPDREPHLVFANRLVYDLDCSVFRKYNGTNTNLAMHHSFKKGVIRPNRVENWWDWSKSDQENFEIVRDQHMKVDPDRHYDLVINRT